MKARPAALGPEFQLETLEDADKALHEMSWLTSFQESIEAPAKVRAEALKTETQGKLRIEIDGQPLTVKQRWEQLRDALWAWCEQHLTAHLPRGKKTLKLSHGDLKTRKNEAAVQIAEGTTETEVALEIARSGNLIELVDDLLDQELVLEHQPAGIRFRNLLTVQFSLAKDPIKAEWAKRPEVRELLQSLSISVVEQQQFTIAPAKVQLATTDE